MLARDAGLAISSDALAKVIPISRAMSGLGRLGALKIPLLKETTEIVYKNALTPFSQILSWAKGLTTPASDAYLKSTVTTAVRAIDPEDTATLGLFQKLVVSAPAGVAKLDVASADALYKSILSAAVATYKARLTAAEALAARGINYARPGNEFDAIVIRDNSISKLNSLAGYASPRSARHWLGGARFRQARARCAPGKLGDPGSACLDSRASGITRRSHRATFAGRAGKLQCHTLARALHGGGASLALFAAGSALG